MVMEYQGKNILKGQGKNLLKNDNLKNLYSIYKFKLKIKAQHRVNETKAKYAQISDAITL